MNSGYRAKPSQASAGSSLSSSRFRKFFVLSSRPKHKAHATFSNYNKEAKQVFIHQNELTDTLQVQTQKTVADSENYVCTVSHGISFGSKGQHGFPPDYTLSANFRSLKGNLVSQMTTNRLYFANLRMKVSAESSLEASYHSQANPMNPTEFHSSLKAIYDYKGNDYRLTGKADLVEQSYSAAYMQQLSESISAGLQAQYNIEQRKSALVSVLRYFVQNKDVKGTGRLVALEAKMEDGAVSGQSPLSKQDLVLKAYYHDDVTHNVRMCGELIYNCAERDAKFKYGFMHSFFDGKFKASVNQDWHIQAMLEHKVTPQAQVAFVAEANPMKAEFKFGATIQYSAPV